MTSRHYRTYNCPLSSSATSPDTKSLRVELGFVPIFQYVSCSCSSIFYSYRTSSLSWILGINFSWKNYSKYSKSYFWSMVKIAPAYYIVLILSFFWSIYLSWYSIEGLISLFSGLTFMNWNSPMTFFPSIVNGPLWFIWYDMMGYLFTITMMLGLTRIDRRYITPMITFYTLLFLALHLFFISLPWPKGSGIVSVWFPHYSPFIFGIYSILGMSYRGYYSPLSESEEKYWLGFCISFLDCFDIWLSLDYSMSTGSCLFISDEPISSSTRSMTLGTWYILTYLFTIFWSPHGQSILSLACINII